jgi:hypothetical protein
MNPSGAQFSDCRTWRYALWRTWNEEDGHVMFIGLNPSTADENKDDPTVRRCIRFAKTWGFGGIHMLNIFAFRATKPSDLFNAKDPIGPENNRFLEMYHDPAGRTIACWGAYGSYGDRGEAVAAMLKGLDCLGTTKDGHPRHPLYLKADTEPIPYEQLR